MSRTFTALSPDYSTLFQFLSIGAYRSSAAGDMVSANPALVRLNGYEDEATMLAEVNRRQSDWYVLPGQRGHFHRLLARDGFVRGLVSEVVRPVDGVRRWVSENAHSVCDPAGRLMYYEGTVEDITSQVEAQDALARSERQLRLLTAQIPGMVFVVHVTPDGQRSYRFVSPGVRDIYGFGPEDLMRDPMLMARYRHPEDSDLLHRNMGKIFAGDTDIMDEYRVVLPGGGIKWLMRRSTMVSEDATGQVRVGLLLDITDRKQAEMALRESEAVWKLALDSAGDGVWDWNLSTNTEYVSPRFKAMYGFAADDELDWSRELDARTHPDDLPRRLADRAAHFEGRERVYRNERRIRCRDGNWKWVLSRGMVISRDDSGRPVRMVGTHTDISQLRAAEAHQRELESLLRESQKMEAIGTLAGGVAHDFNNLLAVILGNLELAREDVGPDHVAQESLIEIHRAALRARELVQQILAFSRRQTQELQRQPLQRLVEESLRLLRSLLPAGVRVNTQLNAEVLSVLADATQIQQVLMNLCSNAWQSMDQKPGEITVTLEETEVDATQALHLGHIAPGTYACLSVVDNGKGMDEDTRRRIFEPFFTTKGPGSGTGLGLSVVHGIVKAHQGAINVHSELGKGSRFDIYLPLAQDAGAPEQAELVRPALSAHGDGNGRHIVYVDDYEAMVFLAGRLLGKRGYRVSTFVSGEEALAWWRGTLESVDLWVTDQNMPGMSGVELARSVRASRPQQRVAIVSGDVNEQLLQQAHAAGVEAVLGKQDNMDALADAVFQLLDNPSG